MGSITAGLYARVSTDSQARGNTIASQLAALHERACADAIRIDITPTSTRAAAAQRWLARLWNAYAMP